MRSDILAQLEKAMEQGSIVTLVTVLSGPNMGAQMVLHSEGDRCGSLGSADLEARAAAEAAGLALSQGARRLSVEDAGMDADLDDGTEVDLFLEVHAPPPKLIIVGAVHVAAVLVRLANNIGLRTVVVDPRTAFATVERFGHADALLHDWPDEALMAEGIDGNTFVALLSHDLKLDIPALEVALPRARYVGALGSRKTHGKRLAALRERGVPEELMRRIHNPIGLNLGGRKAEEIAVSVLAEIVAVSHGRDARPIP